MKSKKLLHGLTQIETNKEFIIVIARSISDVAICSENNSFIAKSYYLNYKQIASLPDGRSQRHDLNNSLFAISIFSKKHLLFHNNDKKPPRPFAPPANCAVKKY